MEAPQKLGYDAPRVRQVEDSLDRWRHVRVDGFDKEHPAGMVYSNLV